jgi:hypothetical protein
VSLSTRPLQPRSTDRPRPHVSFQRYMGERVHQVHDAEYNCSRVLRHDHRAEARLKTGSRRLARRLWRVTWCTFAPLCSAVKSDRALSIACAKPATCATTSKGRTSIRYQEGNSYEPRGTLFKPRDPLLRPFFVRYLEADLSASLDGLGGDGLSGDALGSGRRPGILKPTP